MMTEEDTPMVVIVNENAVQDGVSSNNDNVLSKLEVTAEMIGVPKIDNTNKGRVFRYYAF